MKANKDLRRGEGKLLRSTPSNVKSLANSARNETVLQEVLWESRGVGVAFTQSWVLLALCDFAGFDTSVKFASCREQHPKHLGIRVRKPVKQ